MIQKLLIIGCILLIIFLIIKFIRSNYKLKYDSITFFEGCLGSGKTTIITRLAINERRRRVIFNFFRPFLIPVVNILLFIIPFVNIVYGLLCLIRHEIIYKPEKRGTDIYSNYPIWINRRVGFSYAINKDLLAWLYRVNEDCIICLDEVGYLFPNENKKTDDLYTFCLTWIRHGTNCLMFCASQSLSECNITFRRKVNRCYHLCNFCNSIPFFKKVQITMSIISEDISTITTDHIEDREENWFRFKYPRRHFKSRYGKNYYLLPDDDIKKLSYDYEKTFSMLHLENGSKWESYYYEFDNVKQS